MQALILDRTHAVLVADDRVPQVPIDDDRVASQRRPLQTLEAGLAIAGITVPAPAGSSPRPDGGRDFAFIVDRFDAPAGMAWRPIRDVAANDAIWDLYVRLVLGGYTPSTRAIDVWSFGGTDKEMASQLAHLVVCGAKRVTMGWLDWARRLDIPIAYEGAINIVTDGFGFPRIVLRSVEVRVMPFGEIDEASAAAEGEGDLTYADWRDSHTRFFGAEAARLGLVFDDSAMTAVERFEILHVIGAPGQLG